MIKFCIFFNQDVSVSLNWFFSFSPSGISKKPFFLLAYHLDSARQCLGSPESRLHFISISFTSLLLWYWIALVIPHELEWWRLFVCPFPFTVKKLLNFCEGAFALSINFAPSLIPEFCIIRFLYLPESLPCASDSRASLNPIHLALADLSVLLGLIASAVVADPWQIEFFLTSEKC